MKKSVSAKGIALVLAVMLLISLIPVLAASFYSLPMWDDQHFSKEVHAVISSEGGGLTAIGAALQKASTVYMDWQGTYAAIFLFALQPGVFSLDLYFLTTFIIVFFVIFSTIFFIHTVVTKILNSKWEYGLVVSLAVLLVSIQFLPDKHQGLYYWNGASYYSLFYSFALLLFSSVFRIYSALKKLHSIVWFIIALSLSFITGGGNYSTALTSEVIMFLSLFYVFFISKRRSHQVFMHLFVLLVLTVGFIVSMIAPGNSVRAALNPSLSPLNAMLQSIWVSLRLWGQWTGLPQVVLFVALTPFLYRLARDFKFEFKYPIGVLALTFLIFATQLTPPLYAMSHIGYGRQINIYYYSYYLAILFCIFYLCGWIHQKGIFKIEIRPKFYSKYFLLTVLLLFGIFTAGCVQSGRYTHNGGFEFGIGFKNLTSVDISLGILNGSVKHWHDEYQDILRQFELGISEVPDIKSNLDFFPPIGLQEDPEYWRNKSYAEYYNLDKVVLKDE